MPTSNSWDAFMSSYVNNTKADSDVVKQQSSTDSPWAIDAADFKKQVNGVLNSDNYWADANGSEDKGPHLELANGKTWRPSGAQSGINFVPAGTVESVPSGLDSEGNTTYTTHKTTEDRWTVMGDMSAMLGREGSDTHATVTYHEVDGKMVPVDTPVLNQWHPDHSLRNTIAAAASMYFGSQFLMGDALTAGTTTNGAIAAAPEVAGTTGATVGANVAATGAADVAGLAAADSAAVLAEGAEAGLTTSYGAATGGGLINAATDVASGANTAQETFRGLELDDQAKGAGETFGQMISRVTGLNSIGSLADSASSVFSAANSFFDSTLGKSLLGGLGIAFKNQNDKEIQQMRNQGAIDVVNEQEKNRLAAQKTYNDSFAGMYKPWENKTNTPKQILNSSGAPIWQNGIINGART